MVDWKSVSELQVDAAAFSKLIHALLGLYIYEWFITLQFDWSFISGKKRLRWPLIFYFLNRYLLLISFIGIAISLDSTQKIDCQALYTFNQITGNAAVGMASINLSLRTIAVWSRNKFIIGLLVLLIFGHWSLILQGILLDAVWTDGVGCVITKTNTRVLAATFIYSMCFDFIVLVLNAYKLYGSSLGSSRIAKMIFEDGLIFFMIAFLANLLATVFMLLNLNAVMSVMFNVPAAVASTIVACRVVRRLTKFTNTNAEVYGASSSASAANPNFRTVQSARHVTTIGSMQRTGVHVQMETFTRQDDDIEANVKESHDTNGSETDIHLERKLEPL